MPLMYCCFSGTRPKHNVFCVTVFAISRSRCCIILLPAIDSWRFFAGLMRERRRFWAWRRAVWGRSSGVSEHLAQQHSSRHQRPPSTTSPSARSDVTCTHVSPTRSSWQSSVYWMGWLPMGSCDQIPQRARCVESCIRWGSATDQRNERCMSERRRWTSSAAAFKLWVHPGPRRGTGAPDRWCPRSEAVCGEPPARIQSSAVRASSDNVCVAASTQRDTAAVCKRGCIQWVAVNVHTVPTNKRQVSTPGQYDHRF